MTENEIQHELGLMGFADGELYEDAEQVRHYLSVAEQRAMFGSEATMPQEQLDQIAEWVLQQRYHMEPAPREATAGE